MIRISFKPDACRLLNRVCYRGRCKSAFLIIGLTCSLAGCLFEYDEGSGQGRGGSRPQVLAVCYDVSQSARQIPELTPFLVDTMLSLVRNRSGEFAFTSIEARKPQLVRLRFEAETGSILEKKRRKELNDRQLSRVREAVYSSITERPAMRSRVFDSIELMLTFLSEPHLPKKADKFLIVISDFEDDVRDLNRRQPIPVPADVTVITIGAEPLTVEQVLTGPGKIIPYTNIDGLIHYLGMERSHDTL